MVGGVNLLQVMDLLCLLSQGSEEARSQLIQMAVDLRQEIDCLQAALELVREVFGEDL
jgi:hypothetical protein